MPVHKGIRCNVIIDGSPAIEYSPSMDYITSCVFIAAREGQRYTIEIEASKTGSNWHKIFLYVDGRVLVKAGAERIGDKDLEYEIDTVVDGVADSGYVTERYLEFRKIEVVDEDVKSNQTSDIMIKRLGEILVNIWRCEEPHSEIKNVSPFKPKDAQPVSEKSIKGRSLSHCTQLSSQHRDPRPFIVSMYEAKPIDPDDEPYASFLFRYMSQELLEAQGIAPKPARLIFHGDLRHMDESQKDQEIIRLRKELEESRLKIKQEDEDAGYIAPGVQPAYKKKEKSAAVYIDLTGEDC
ncbi:hypothetical protein TWF506_005763 [Arthrobotrys conoides]|uniref:DUF7918 domain-containing protein n=1 Tax=Arthrobotrys conoides TaxID=74498 RepID=A0AAN8NU92_9PEZI